MLQEDEKLELARLVSSAEHLLHHHHLKQVFENVNPDFVPALTPQQCNMIMTIRKRGSMTIKQLAQALCVKAPATSTMVERLVELRLLTREENPADRREVIVQVSPEEETVIQEIDRRHLQLTLDLFEKLGEKHTRMWGELCRRFHEILADEPI